MSQTMHSATEHGDHIPRGMLAAIGAMLLLSLVAVALVRWSGIEIRVPDAPAAETRALRFEDRPDGGVAVIDHASNQVVVTLQGEQGFVRGALRALARQRKLAGLDHTQPFLLIGRADGRLTLEDPATRQRIDLESFGPMHAASFARLLRTPPATTAAQPAR